MRNWMHWMRAGQLATGMLALTLAAGMTACGDDSAVSGGVSVSGTDGSGGGGSLSGDDATTGSDTTTLADGSVSTVCGNGKCEGPSESPANCPADCPSGGSDATTGPAVCGNGVCEGPGETMFLCAADCKTPATSQEACKHKACQPEYDACGNDPACLEAAKCVNAAQGQQQAQACIKDQKSGQELNALQQCIQQANCTAGGLLNCGNGTCDADETQLTCPADCKAPVDPQETCLQKGCAAEYKACQADAACVKTVDCLNNNQNNPQQCMQGGPGGMSQALQGLFQCGQQAGCFQQGGGGGGGGGTADTCGNGTCDQGETMLTCPADCKQPKTQTEACYHQACPDQYAKCSADPACVKSVDCFNTGGTPQQCGQNANQQALNQCIQQSGCNGGGGGGGGGTLQNCGNGQCDNNETNLTCPKDCPTTDTNGTCLKNFCPDAYKNCQNDTNCTSAIDCYNQGGNPQQCFQGAGGPGGGGALGAILQCVQQSGCYNGGGGGGGGGTAQTTCVGNCGSYSQVQGSCQCDNQCVQAGDCCKDYTSACGGGGGGQTPVCGDGTCSAPTETATNCPADCTTQPKPCKTKSDCAATEVCCGLASGSVCTAIGQCK